MKERKVLMQGGVVDRLGRAAGRAGSYYREPAARARIGYSVRSAGWIRDQPYHSTLGTYHQDIMLMLFVAGRGAYRTAGADIAILPGMVGLVLPGPDVGILMAEPTAPYEHFYCRFAGTEAEATARRISEAHDHEVFFVWKYWREHQDLFRQLSLHGPNLGEEPDRMRLVDALCAGVLACLDNPAPDPQRRLTAFSLEKYMQAHLSEPICLDRMAAAFGVSKPHLCRVARLLLGDTLVRYWLRMKMQWAERLLHDPALRIGDVAIRVGIEDPFYFSRVFKAHHDASPSAWRRKAIHGSTS